MGRIRKVSVVVAARSHFSTIGQKNRDTRHVPLFEVDKDTKHVAEIKPTTFPEAWLVGAPGPRGVGYHCARARGRRFHGRNVGVRPFRSHQRTSRHSRHRADRAGSPPGSSSSSSSAMGPARPRLARRSDTSPTWPPRSSLMSSRCTPDTTRSQRQRLGTSCLSCLAGAKRSLRSSTTSPGSCSRPVITAPRSPRRCYG